MSNPVAELPHLIDLRLQIRVQVLVHPRQYPEATVLDRVFHLVDGVVQRGMTGRDGQLPLDALQSLTPNLGFEDREQEQDGKVVEVLQDLPRLFLDFIKMAAGDCRLQATEECRPPSLMLTVDRNAPIVYA
jgi:hypothetical protein